MDIKRTKFYSIAVEDKPGEVLRFCKAMRDAGVNMMGLWGLGVGSGRGNLYAIPQDAAKFAKAAQNWKPTEKTCFVVTGEDRIGVLVDTLDRVAKQGINLQAVDAMGVAGHCGAVLWPQDGDIDKLGKALGVA
jgi:hypothetical protein